ncbi:hypothetical protein QAD02_016506, partial [Eretmocerus hayati]
ILYITLVDASNFDVVVENVAATTFTNTWFIRCVAMSIQASKFKNLYLEAVENWESITDDQEKIVLTNFVRLARLFTLVLAAYIICNTFATLTFTPLTCALLDTYFPMENGTEYKFIPFQVHFYVFDKKDAYWLIWLHIDVATCVGMIIIAGFDGMQIMFTREICGLFEVLSLRLSNYIDSRRSAHLNREDSKEKGNAAGLEQCVILHNQTLRFCSLVEETYNLASLSTELGIVLMLSMMYYHFRYARTHIIKRGANCLLIVGVNATLFLMNWVGQEVSNYSGKIFDSAYQSDWHVMDTKERKMLLIIMQNSIAPFVLTSGRIFPLSLESFGK